MRLSNLIACSKELKLSGPDVEITGLTTDSRNVKPGFLFIAVPGTKEDGRAYIEQAIQRGAVAALVPNNNVPTLSVSFITAANIRKAASDLAATFYPQQPETIAAVTGTSGKTSTVQFIREMWQALGHQSASMGTFGFITPEESRYSSINTPDPVVLHKTLEEAVSKKITHLAMEASSHGLAMHRMDGVKVKVGGFTNLSRDHLDFHATMEEYLQAKLRLFTDLIVKGGTAVLNADIPEFEILNQAATSHGLKVVTYGAKGKDIRLINAKPDAKGQQLQLEVFGKKYETSFSVMGSFQVWNALCALGIVIASGEQTDKAVATLAKLSDVPGRLQLAGVSKTGGTIFVDYAHKPDALEKVLSALRPHVAENGAKLGVIFGCGGDRDPGKRPVMGEIAQRLADWVIVTDDNPRHEEPTMIRKAILTGCKPGPALKEIGDRAEAIRTGISLLQKGDVLIIAGKGHESGQIVGDKTLPFDDAEVAKKALTD